VVVHYFGYAMPTCDAAIMAHEAGGLLLEDCAHCLVNPDPKNDCADIALYSMNKILPVSDGAMLFSRSPNADVSMPKDLRPSDDVAVNAYFQHMVANRFIALTSSSLYPEAHAQSLNHYEDYYRSISSDMQPRAMSALARAFRNDLDFHGIVKIRRENASKIIKRLRSRYLFRNDVPIFALPVRCGHRLRAADQMAKLGVAAEIVSDRWISPPSGSPARDFWDKHLLLPIHESMTPSDIVKVAVAVWRSA
jgi:hypothetical protein